MNRSNLILALATPLTAGAFVLASAAPAEAVQPYIGGQVGYNFLLGNDQFDDDVAYGGTLGIDFAGLRDSGFALELSLLYAEYEGEDCADLADANGVGSGGELICRNIRNRLDLDAELQFLSIGLAGRYNLDLGGARLYLLAGGELHLADFEIRADAINRSRSSDNEEWGFVAGAGLEIPLGEHVSIGPDVRYHVLFTDNFDSIDEIDDTDIEDAPDFLSVVGRVNVYF